MGIEQSGGVDREKARVEGVPGADRDREDDLEHEEPEGRKEGEEGRRPEQRPEDGGEGRGSVRRRRTA